jgi:hypothetical protein
MTIEDVQRLLPGSEHAAVVDLTAADVALAPGSRRLYVGGAGDVKVDTVGGEAGVVFQSVIAGMYLDVRATKVYKVGTTATKIVALW